MDQHVRNRVNIKLLLLIYAYNRMSLQSAIIGFLISKLLALPITPQETVVVQSTAVATGTVCQLFKAVSDVESSNLVL